jgi:hypothetical protein
MTHKQTQGNSMPEAYITRTQTQSRGRYKIFEESTSLKSEATTPIKKIENGKVYIQSGENFEIELYNPTQKLVLAKLSFNGKDEDSPGLVLKPGQRIYLDRYLTEAVKFKFDTYEIDNSGESLDATAKNGLLKVSFYEESVNNPITTSNSGHTTIIHNYPYYRPINPYNWPYRKPWYNEWYINDNNNFYGNITNGFSSNTANFNLNSNNLNTNDCSYYTSSESNLSDSLKENVEFSDEFYETLASLSDKLETGRIEKGAVSEQKFVDVNYNFNSYTCNEVVITMLPVSRKPLEAKDLNVFCTGCGTKAKKNHIFCSKCGTKLE